LEDWKERVPAEFILSEIRYRYQALAEAFGTGWVDILLLFLFNILFLVATFIKFNKYDVL